MIIDWPENLIDAIARRKCVIFLGAGISANSETSNGKHPATWESFLNDIRSKRSNKLSDHADVLGRLLLEKNYLNSNLLKALI